jgi:integrase
VRKKLSQVSVALDEGTYIEPSRLTVGEWLEIWRDEYCANAVKPSTLHNYDKSIQGYLKPSLAAVKLSKLTAHTVQRMINNLQKPDGERKALSAKTIKNIQGVLHKALHQAVLLDYIRVNPAGRCELPQIIKKEIAPPDMTQISTFLDAIKGHIYEPLFFVSLFTGLRQSEALGLRWSCVDFERGIITINAQLTRDYKNGGYVFDETTKNKKPRRITPASFVMETLCKWRNVQAGWRTHAAEAWSESNYVFTNEIGEHLKHPTVQKNFKAIVRKLGMEETRYHDMRHFFAVASLHAGDDIKTVQENLGHHTAAFTLDVYGHVTEQMKTESALRMEKLARASIGVKRLNSVFYEGSQGSEKVNPD